MHQFLQHFVFITLSIPDVEKAFSFLTEVRVEDCLPFYGGINANKKENFAGLHLGIIGDHFRVNAKKNGDHFGVRDHFLVCTEPLVSSCFLISISSIF